MDLNIASCVSWTMIHIDSTSLSPASVSVKLRSREAENAEFEEPYRRAVGSSILLANTFRFDIANAIHDVARHVSNSNAEH